MMRSAFIEMPLNEHEKAIITGRVGGAKHVFAGFQNQLGAKYKIPRPSVLMSTPKTWRACKGCCTSTGNSRIVAVDHGNGIISYKKCGICGGTGMRYN